MEQSAKPLNYKALSWTIGAHAILLLIFLFWKFSTPAAAAPVAEMGMEVNLGTSADGSGTDQPMDMEDPAPEAAANNARATTSDANAEKEVEQTDDADAPEVAPVKATPTPARTDRPNNRPVTRTNTPVAAQQQPKPTPAAQPQRPKFVYQGSTGKGGNGAASNSPGGSEGNTTGDGDRGVPHGTPGAPNYTGNPGRGTGGISYSLDGRNIVAYPPKEAEFREGGRVVVRITVNKEGAIVSKNIKTSTNAELSAIALRKLSQVKFNRSDDAPAEQFGNITFVFKARN